MNRNAFLGAIVKQTKHMHSSSSLSLHSVHASPGQITAKFERSLKSPTYGARSHEILNGWLEMSARPNWTSISPSGFGPCTSKVCVMYGVNCRFPMIDVTGSKSAFIILSDLLVLVIVLHAWHALMHWWHSIFS